MLSKLFCVAAILVATTPGGFGQAELTTAQIAKLVSPSVVVIEGKTDSWRVLGSGFIVSKDGKIVTNLHVIRELKAASVQTVARDIFDSISVLAVDERRDLAIIESPVSIFRLWNWGTRTTCLLENLL